MSAMALVAALEQARRERDTAEAKLAAVRALCEAHAGDDGHAYLIDRDDVLTILDADQ